MGAMIGLVPATADAAVAAGRGIEVFYGRDFVGIVGYPANTPVKVEVYRGTERIGIAEYPTDSTGFLEINHTGEGDCWQGEFTPNIEPGDEVRATVAGQTPDSTITRNVWLDEAATVYNENAGTITVKGRALSMPPGAPIAPGSDVLEVRMNVDGTWSTTGRKDLRADVGASVDGNGNFSYTFTGLTATDVQNGRTSEKAIEWSPGGETEPIPEITVFDGTEGPFGSCPPLLPDDRIAPSQVTGVVSSQPVAGTVELDWAAASDNVAVTGYTVTRLHVETNTTTTYAVAGNTLFFSQTRVPNGTYDYTVRARDAAGNQGLASSPATRVVVGGTSTNVAPGAPTMGTVTPGDGSATVNWTRPTQSGTPTLTGYKVDVFQGPSTTPLRTVAVTDATATSTTVTDLTNGQSYSFTVRATNGTDGPASARSTAVTPQAATSATPGAPTLGTLTPGNARVTVRWSAPTNIGSSAITGYSVRAYTGTGGTVFSATSAGSAARSVVVTGLTNGTAYTFDVVALNSAGPGQPSARSAPVTPATVPGAPTMVTAAAGNASATVNWTEPTSTGGSAITSYSVQVRTGTTVLRTVTGIAPDARSTVVTGLTNGTAYNFRVRAVNAIGNGVLSTASNTVTPQATSTATVPATPAAPTASAGNGSATVSWTAPANGGSAITGYQLRVFNSAGQVGATRLLGNVTSTSVTGLTNGTAYTFDVAATNAIGTGAFSPRSVAVTPTATTTGTDTTRPTVGLRSPAGGTTGVNRTSVVVTGIMSEQVTGITTTSVVLRPTGTVNNVATTVTYDSETREVTLDPTVTLAANAKYTVVFNPSASPTIKDVAGNVMAQTSWAFTTGP